LITIVTHASGFGLKASSTEKNSGTEKVGKQQQEKTAGRHKEGLSNHRILFNDESHSASASSAATCGCKQQEQCEQQLQQPSSLRATLTSRKFTTFASIKQRSPTATHIKC
jgi:hypothetical protein